jgi:hypothetical protein
MPKTFPLRTSFNSGEISLLCDFRSDISKYDSACIILENAIPLVEGGAKKMPGTYFAGATALGGCMFTGSIASGSPSILTVDSVNYGTIQVGQVLTGNGVIPGTTVTAYGTGEGLAGSYQVTGNQTIPIGAMQAASNGKSRLVPFQFSTIQGAILELSAGIIRIWEGASQGSWSLGLALQVPNEAAYNPVTAYVATNAALVGPTFVAYFNNLGVPVADGILYISAPYGSNNATTVPITFLVNSSDNLVVNAVGTSPNQGIWIYLANATAAKNAATLIQAAIRALVSLNSSSNFVDLTAWTVTPDPVYYASPWISLTAGGGAHFATEWAIPSLIAYCVQANQNDQFPVRLTGSYPTPYAWNNPYWEQFNEQNEPPIELSTPYMEADLFNLDCSTQSADVLWIFHPNYPPAVVERLSANSWKYSTSLPGQQAGEPAYRGTLDVVTTGYSALGQCITLISQSASCIVVLSTGSASQPFANGQRIYINECSGMPELNQGEFLVSGMTYGSVSVPVIDAAGNSYNLTGTAWYFTPLDPDTGNAVNSSAYLQYQGGGFAVAVVALFAADGDYPACATLYQERLTVGGSLNNPTQLNGSVEDDYPDFICDPNEDDYAFQFTLVSNQLNQLLNMIGTPNALLIGTAGGVWVVAPSTGTSLSQTNVNAAQQGSLGVSQLQPQLVNGSAIFVSRSTRIVTFLVFNFTSNQWDNYDLTRLNRNITIGTSQATSGLAQTAFQEEPYPIFWAVRNDGQLIGLVFNQQDQVYAWFRVNMVGGIIESAAVVTGQGQEDQIVAVVNRTIQGVTQRYVEYFMPQELFHQLSNAFFVHCGQQWQGLGPVNITGITNANPCTVFAPSPPFTDGMLVQISGVLGMTEINQDSTNAYTIAGVTSNSFQLEGMDSTSFGAYAGGGTAMQVTNQVTGMSYLMGQQVTAVGDGAIILQPTAVTSDTVNFPYFCNLITIGLPYQMTVQPTNPVLSSQGGTTRGMKQKLNRVTLSLYESMGGQCGTDLQHMYDITYGPGAFAGTPGMSTGEYTRDVDGDWGDESTFYIRQNQPFPFTLRGLVWRDSANQD